MILFSLMLVLLVIGMAILIGGGLTVLAAFIDVSVCLALMYGAYKLIEWVLTK